MEKELVDEFDGEFMSLLVEIEKRCEKFKKHEQLRIKSWCKKLCQITNNIEWKKNRNLHAICLLDCILNQKFEDPYNKLAPEGAVSIINKTLVKAKLSKKFLESSLDFSKPMENPKEVNKNKIKNNKDNNFIKKQNDYLIDNKNYNPVNINENIKNTKEISNDYYCNINLKNKLLKVKSENEQKDKIIQKLKEDNLKLDKKIQELQKILSSFMALEQ